MEECKKIPIVVGVTGHRNIAAEDKPLLKEQVKQGLREIAEACQTDGGQTPVIMLNGLAQGADILCAEAAFEAEIPVYAVLPCDKEEYAKSFDYEDDKNKLFCYLDKCVRVIIAPDMEQNQQWLARCVGMNEDSYLYRQVGVYIAEHSHVTIALWDGKPPKSQFGCGTAEVIQFALEHKFLGKDRLFKPALTNESAVMWIKSRRQGDAETADVKRQWLISKSSDETGEDYDGYSVLRKPPQFLTEIIRRTVKYNATAAVGIGQNDTVLWENADELDEYHKNLRAHYAKADKLSYKGNQVKYGAIMLALAIIGAIVASTFLMYDDAALPYMIYPCSVAVVLIVALSFWGRKKEYHANYITYRAFAEALRIQFYLTLCLNEAEGSTNVCDLYSWAQKVDMVWARKAIQALDIVSLNNPLLKPDTRRVKEVWIGNNRKPEGQLSYHTRKRKTNLAKQKKIDRLSKLLQAVTIAAYFVILVFEIAADVLKSRDILFFWEGNLFGQISYRSFAAIIVGSFAVVSLLLSGYWGKQSYDRKTDDNVKMSKFYASAYARWDEASNYSEEEFNSFVKEIAREEIVENGIWCSYVAENTLDIDL